MGSSCNTSQQIVTEEFRIEILDEPLQDVHILSPKSSKVKYKAERFEDGIMVSEISAILVKPKNQAQTIKILQQYCSVQEKIIQRREYERRKPLNHLKIRVNSEKHVHWGSAQ